VGDGPPTGSHETILAAMDLVAEHSDREEALPRQELPYNFRITGSYILVSRFSDKQKLAASRSKNLGMLVYPTYT